VIADVSVDVVEDGALDVSATIVVDAIDASTRRRRRQRWPYLHGALFDNDHDDVCDSVDVCHNLDVDAPPDLVSPWSRRR
jgi:hypothetical protein